MTSKEVSETKATGAEPIDEKEATKAVGGIDYRRAARESRERALTAAAWSVMSRRSE